MMRKTKPLGLQGQIKGIRWGQAPPLEPSPAPDLRPLAQAKEGLFVFPPTDLGPGADENERRVIADLLGGGPSLVEMLAEERAEGW
jgi:hypothetical protein